MGKMVKTVEARLVHVREVLADRRRALAVPSGVQVDKEVLLHGDRVMQADPEQEEMGVLMVRVVPVGVAKKHWEFAEAPEQAQTQAARFKTER